MEEEELKRKKAIRKAHRAALTRTIGQVKNLLGETEQDVNKLKHKKSILMEKRSIL